MTDRNRPLLFDADALRAASFIRHVEIHDTLGSTNDRAAELARNPYCEMPALIVAHEQTAGRGRGAHSWWSADGALTFSILIAPQEFGLTSSDWPRLSLTTAVAICDAIEAELAAAPNFAADVRVGIKWPNDVLLGERKVAGILLESPGGPSPAKDRLVVGVGMNVNNSWHTAPPELADIGTALGDATGRLHSFQTVMLAFLTAFLRRTKQLAAGDEELPGRWQSLNMLTGSDVRIESRTGDIEGHCTGIAADGALLIGAGEQSHRVFAGTVTKTARL